MTHRREDGRANLARVRELTREAMKRNVGGYRLECAYGGLAPSCTECVPCDVAMQLKNACDALILLASETDAQARGTLGDRIREQIRRIERAAVHR